MDRLDKPPNRVNVGRNFDCTRWLTSSSENYAWSSCKEFSMSEHETGTVQRFGISDIGGLKNSIGKLFSGIITE